MTTPARMLRDAIEAFHGVCYFSAEHRRPYVEERGLHPWAAYFAQRAAPMGRVGAETVAAVFYFFSPDLVARSIPSVWELVTPEEAVRLRLEATRELFGRLFPEPPDGVDEAVDLARRAVEALEPAGRPLAAGHAAVSPVDDRLTELWRLLAVLREARGDGHVATLVSAGVGPVEALLLSAGHTEFPVEEFRKRRGWSEEAWDAGRDRAAARGWLRPDGTRTEEGERFRTELEEATDRTMSWMLDAIGPAGVVRLAELVQPLSARVVSSGALGWARS